MGFITNDRDLHTIVANRSHGKPSRVETIHNIGTCSIRNCCSIHGPMPGYRCRPGGGNKAFRHLEGSVSSFSRSRAKKAAQLPRLFVDTASPSKSTSTPHLSVG